MADDAAGFTRVEDGGFKRVMPDASAAGFERMPSAAAAPALPAPTERLAPGTPLQQTRQEAPDSFGATLGRMAGAGVEEMKRGWNNPAERVPYTPLPRQPLRLATGALETALSPVNAAIRSFVTKPVEKMTGGLLPAEQTETALLALRPGMTGPRAPSTGPLAEAGRVVEKIFSPETVDLHAESASALLRGSTGKGARDTATTEAVLEPFRKEISKLGNMERLGFIDYVEGRSQPGNKISNPALQPIADKMRDAFKLREDKLAALPSMQRMGFVEDYYPHLWTDPAAAKTFLGSRQGSGGFTKERSIPTVADGIRAGLTPISMDPIETTIRYVANADRYIALNEAVDTARGLGVVKNFPPGKHPDGYVELQGRLGGGDTSRPYAPEGFARVFNNFVSRGFHGVDEAIGKGYDTLRRGTNAITAMELGLSGYHAATMTQEAIVNQLAKSIGALRTGRPGDAAASLVKTPTAFVTQALKGRKLQDVYLGRTPGTAEMREITDLLTEAGGRAKGFKHSPDYEFSGMGSYVTAFRRGALQAQLQADAVQTATGGAGGALKVGARHIGRIMDTVAQPLFEKYIPVLKNGAFYENMADWLKANPTATREQRVRAARQAWDSVDNRFGEMVHDNMTMNRLIKQVGMLAMRSFSWVVGGDIRELGGAARDFMRAPFKQVNNIGPNDTRWTQKMDYALALPLTYGAMAGVYQYLKTGEAPRDLQDLMAPRTGGTDAATGLPERLLMPGWMKDIYGFYEDPVREMTNKVGTGPRMAGELLTNKDWRNDPIASPRTPDEPWVSNVPRWMKEYFTYAGNTLGPISARNLRQGQKTGSNLNPVETAIGVRTAPRSLSDPEGHEKMMQGIRGRAWNTKRRHDARKEKLYQGGSE